MFGRHQALTRIVLIEAASIGPAYTQEVGRFAALVRHHPDDAIAEGSIPPLDTGVAARARLGTLNEVVLQSLQSDLPTLEHAAPPLSALLLRSIGVADDGARAAS